MSDRIVVVREPVVRTVVVREPTVVTIAAPGVQGRRGPQGPRGPAGDETGLGYEYVASTAALLHQIQHGFLYKPAGVTCTDLDGVPLLGFKVTHPAPGVTEVAFGMAVTPTIQLS